MRWFTSWFLVPATILATGLFGSEALGVLIASDSFATSLAGADYTLNTTLMGQSPTTGSTGFVGAWGIGPLDIFLPTAGGLTHPLTPGETAEGQLIVSGTTGSAGAYGARNLSRAIDYTPTDGTYYMSVLLRKDAATDRADLAAGLGMSQSPTTNILNVAGTWIGFVDGGISVFAGPGAIVDTLVPRSETNVGETYLGLLQFDYSTSGPDSVSASVYDSTSKRVANQQFTDLDLDGSLGRFSVLTQDYGPIPRIDEWRFGTELDDVIVPELIRESFYYEFVADILHGGLPDEVLATLELSAVPATHEQVVRLTFTEAGHFAISTLRGHPAVPDVYPGTFDTTVGHFLSDGLGGLISADLYYDAYIIDADAAPGYEFILGARPGKNIVDDAIDEIGFRPSGSNGFGVLGLWRQVKQPGSGKTFSDWARSKGYSPGDAMPGGILAYDTNIESLRGINAYDWNATPAVALYLNGNLLTTLEAGVFSNMKRLESLDLGDNELSIIEDGAFRGLTRLGQLYLYDNPTLTELNFAEAEFLNLWNVDVYGNINVTRVSFKNAVLNQKSLRGLFSTSWPSYGISSIDGITEIDLSGVDFANINDLTPLYEMDDLTDLWLVGTRNLDAFSLDALLDELDTIEGTDVEGILYMTQADFNAFNVAGGGLLAAWHFEEGHHVEFVIPEPASAVLCGLAALASLACPRRRPLRS